jgi:hypothetical protein
MGEGVERGVWLWWPHSRIVYNGALLLAQGQELVRVRLKGHIAEKKPRH